MKVRIVNFKEVKLQIVRFKMIKNIQKNNYFFLPKTKYPYCFSIKIKNNRKKSYIYSVNQSKRKETIQSF